MKLLTPLAFILVAVTLIIWVDETPTTAELVFVNRNEVYTLDPQRMSYLSDLRFAHALYEGLLGWDNRDFTIVPAVAVWPSISEDARVYTFAMTPDARWSNGAPVTAHDFVYAWRRAVLPDSAADYSNLFFAIDGAEAFFTWRTQQITRLLADPDDPATRPAALERLQELLAADPFPNGVATPSREERARITDDDDPWPAVRAWWSRLDAPASREAEVNWRWDLTERRFAETVGVRAIDDNTLEVRLAEPVAYFLDLLCFGVFFPVYRPAVEGWPDDWLADGQNWADVPAPPFPDRRFVSVNPGTGRLEQSHAWARPGHLVGNGPYRLVQWRYKRDLRLAPNEHFRAPELVRNRSVLARTIENTNTAVLAFESGQVDWLIDVSTDYQADMLAQRRVYDERHAVAFAQHRADGLTEDEALAALPPPERGERRDIHAIPAFGVEFFSFNCRPHLADGRPNPFADAAVRRAFTVSVDKSAIVRDVTRLDEPVATTMVPPGSIPGYASPDGLGFDRDRARRELAKAGWQDRDGDGLVEDADGAPFPVIDLLYTTNTPRSKWMSLELRSQWQSELGVRIEPRGSETKFYKEDLKQGQFMIARGRWYGDYGDPTTFLNLFRSTDGNNDRGYVNADVDAMLAEAERSNDPAQRFAILTDLERLLMEEELPLVPICQLVQVYMYDPVRVRGFTHHARLTQFLSGIEVTR